MKATVSDDCIGCGACTAIAEDCFEMIDGKAKAKSCSDDDKLKQARDACPVGAIKLE